MNHSKEDHVSLPPFETRAHVRERQEALWHEADERRLARRLHPTNDHPTDHAPHAQHGTDSPLASLRLRLGHALVLAGTAIEGSSAEETVPSR